MSTYDYQKDKYDSIRLLLKKGKKQEISEHLMNYPYKSMNNFIETAIDNQMNRDKRNRPQD
ncbi:MAG: hypothetical protein IJ617_08890 [Oscillospiraceae bacterium]|nr:hypothetical protein [Oscillospiraceae bacterium]